MSIRIRDVLQLEYINTLNVITDESGFNRIITRVGILDHEILENNYDVFEKGEFVISTLSVARDDVNLVFKAIKELINVEVAGLAIKSIYYHELPFEIIEFANKNNFPIFIFETTFIENLINSINSALNSNQLHDIYESKIEALLAGNISKHIYKQLIDEINPNFKDNHNVYFLKEKRYESAVNLVNKANLFIKISSKYPYYSVLKFRTGLLIILTCENECNQNNIKFFQLLEQLNIDKSNYYIGKSISYKYLNKLDLSITEAYMAYQTGEICNKDFNEYSNIGIYKLIIPMMDQPQSILYAKELIEPIISYDKQYNSYLYETIKTYFDNGCNTKATAELLFQHKNTILYRINKIKELIGPFSNDLDFNSQLYMSIKLYDALYQSPNHKI